MILKTQLKRKIKDLIKSIIKLVVLLLVFGSCNHLTVPEGVQKALDLAGDNEKELASVIRHYSKKPEDSLKLKAAYFLIEYMPDHTFETSEEDFSNAFQKASQFRKEYMTNFPDRNLRKISSVTREKLNSQLDSIGKIKGFTNLKTVYDLKFLSGKTIIDNIDLAFLAYEENPLKLTHNFEDFLKYIVPYRSSYEPFEANNRKALFEKYKWIHDSLRLYPIEQVIKKVYETANIKSMMGKNKYCRRLYTTSEIESIHVGTCADVCNYFVNVLRAVGIPSGIHYLSKWGDEHYNIFHSWIFYKINDSIVPLNAGNYWNVRKRYALSSIPIIEELTYSKISKDEKNVTNYYRDTYDITIQPIWNEHILKENPSYLGVFDSREGWFEVAESAIVTDHKIQFRNMGNNVVYFPFVKHEGVKKPINFPFELTKDGKILFFNNIEEKITQAQVLRKYAPFRVRTKKQKQMRVQNLSGLMLQGSNSKLAGNFKNLYQIANYKSTQQKVIILDNLSTYKYFRLKGLEGRTVNLAHFELLDAKENQITDWKSIREVEERGDELDKLIDGNPLTYINRKDLQLTYTAPAKKTVSGFKIQARNDDNHINKGDHYELFYWNKEWVSLGKQKAKDTVLIYQNIPKRALYTLKNHTAGKEEFIFKFDDKGNQIWIGVSEYENDDAIFNL